ncbi:HTH CenpB-type DNA-binding domain [Lasallia pustulata]|uniref:HTH CenpB-type DNA-binding domain n=1 Tax=Lasallia pustulata TaxID=136370 RepID=A0A1W5CV08_9LECA|nr:HTH CenpB-type DNA-binding domain [Lasallia pustulata]
MAYELLQKRGVYEELGEQWIARFLARHPELKLKFINPIEKERILATDPTIFQHYFGLYKSTKEQYDIDNENEWNMDEKGVAMGVIRKTKVIIPKRDIPQYMAVCGNQEWVTLIESIGLSGRSLKPWVIFKGKQHMKAWWDIFTTGHISVSKNGWTDNDICFEWLKRCFELETRPITPGKWRFLLFNGHVSHLTGRAIDFCLEHKILVRVQAESNYWQEAFVKLAKACGQNMALSTIQGQTIAEMVEASKQQTRKGKRSHKTYGEARVMSKEEVERIEAQREDKRDAKKAKAWSS